MGSAMPPPAVLFDTSELTMIDSEITRTHATLPVDFIVVPYDDGRRGWRMGAGPLSFIGSDLPARVAPTARSRVQLVESGAAQPLASAIELAARVAAEVAASRSADRFPVVLAGNCSATVGAVAGLRSDRLGVVWLDAHGDLNTPETSPSGFLDGMAAATLMGWCHVEAFAPVLGGRVLPPRRLLTLGARAFDPDEREHAVAKGVRFSSAEPGELEPVLDAFLRDVDEVYVHLDLDVLDPDRYGQANGFREPGGLEAEQVVRVLHRLARHGPVAGLTVSAYDPACDPEGRFREAAMSLIVETLRIATSGAD